MGTKSTFSGKPISDSWLPHYPASPKLRGMSVEAGNPFSGPFSSP